MTDGEAAPDVVGVVGTDTRRVAAAVEAAGGTPRVGDPGNVIAADPGAVIAVGERAVLDLVERSVSFPVVAVGAGPGVASVPADATEAAAREVVTGEWADDARHLVAAVVGGRHRARALADLMLVSAEPARISEYAVRIGGEQIAKFRADGVVLATPTGSAGYARAAGGPLVAPHQPVVSVVPVSPYATDPDQWIAPVDDVAVTVERNETEVHLLADDRTVGQVPVGTPVEVVHAGEFPLATVSDSRAWYESGQPRVEKH
ncbi:ATP-NAD kinase [Halobacteriales archaeon QS_1_68_17]|nr:MAG: ATP-NAD kinase [Halobacteriales archaeon QS_1_68_17]